MLFKQIKIVYRLRNILDNFSLFRRFFYWHAENSSIEKISLQKIRWRNNNSNKSTSIDFEKMWKVNNDGDREKEHAISKSNKTVYYNTLCSI